MTGQSSSNLDSASPKFIENKKVPNILIVHSFMEALLTIFSKKIIFYVVY